MAQEHSCDNLTKEPMIAACRNSRDLANTTSLHSLSIVDVSRARDFYRDTLGLRLIMEEPPFALVFDANGIMLRLGMAKELPPAHGTVLGWQVPEITATVKDLGQAGVRFERFGGHGSR